MEVRDEQPLKHSTPILVMEEEEGMSMEVRALQFLKQFLPRLVTEEGMSIEVRALQAEKHSSPRLVTEEGMSMEVRAEQPRKE